MSNRSSTRESYKPVGPQRSSAPVVKKTASIRAGKATRTSAFITPHVKIPPKWGWHFRTLLALRDHLRRVKGDRLREPFEAMEPPSLHAEDLFNELYDRELAQKLTPIPAEALREIDDAILRLEKGTFGKCQATGRAISKVRLRATPWCRYAFDPVVRDTLHRQ